MKCKPLKLLILYCLAFPDELHFITKKKKRTFRTAIGFHITKCLERVATSFWIHPIFPVSCRIAGCYDVLTRFSSSCRDRPQESYGKEIVKFLVKKASKESAKQARALDGGLRE